MTPPTGERLLRYVGDRVRFTLGHGGLDALPKTWRAFLRTELGRGQVLRREIVRARGGTLPPPGAAWRDIPMERTEAGWGLELALTEVGFFKAKAYAVDEQGFQVWPEGPDVGIAVHPSDYRTANTIYCAFTRLFGATQGLVSAADARLEARLKRLDALGYTVIPPSGKLRDVRRELPHIVDTLGCRILHLLPVNPTPTTFARFGRFGSPYAGLDLTAIDPALVEFDRRSTGVDQFCELAYAVHARGARLFLDLVINHTGWSSTLYEQHPEWYLRQPDGTFVSPGAWGVTWEDLVDLDEQHADLWDHVAEAFLTWCRRGVDGFRCDAGYLIPMPVWRYIIARVREEYPETLFLLEGLGGAWHDTENLLTEGGMQWAYSELFQEFSGVQVAGYLQHAIRQGRRVGVLVHYSETHDNDRLAKKSRAWSLLRNRLSALASTSGAYGFTCGVEWLATEKIKVHGCTGLAWGNATNLLPELARLNRLLADHPCFFDGAELTRLSPADAPVFVLQRDAAGGQDRVLVLVNTDAQQPQSVVLEAATWSALMPGPVAAGGPAPGLVDLLGQSLPAAETTESGRRKLVLEPCACFCLAAAASPRGRHGAEYRRVWAQVAWALNALRTVLDPEDIGPFDAAALAALVDRDAGGFLGALSRLDHRLARRDLMASLQQAAVPGGYPAVVVWELIDRRRVTPVPPGHWLLLRDSAAFRASLRPSGGGPAQHVHSIPVRAGHVAALLPPDGGGDAALSLERYAEADPQVRAGIRCLRASPDEATCPPQLPETQTVLLTNGRGGMARVCLDLGRVRSKYDCLLGANLHPAFPVDRHIFAKRVRVWANAGGFISPLDARNLVDFRAGPPADWEFGAHAGDGRFVSIRVRVAMLPGRNTTVLQFARGRCGAATAEDPAVRLTVRVDIEDRNFHWETQRNSGAEAHFTAHTHTLNGQPGFSFAPAADRRMRVYADPGIYYPAPEWSEHLPHPVEASRGQVPQGDAYSPGWFDLPLTLGVPVTLVVTADPTDPSPREIEPVMTPAPAGPGEQPLPSPTALAGCPSSAASFTDRLELGARAFLARRDEGKTVIAGYPWFLDWGRDTLICARGLLVAGMREEVRQLLVTFGRFEDHGTLPNTIHGHDASNRETTDAALWYGIVCEEWAGERRVRKRDPAASPPARSLLDTDLPPYGMTVDPRGRTVADVLRSIAVHYRRGTPNGIQMDPESGLIWSPAHFTWMDTNYPAGTPREGYPIEIQVLWIRLLRQLERLGVAPEGEPWGALAARATASFERWYWLDEHGYYADGRWAKSGAPASGAVPDTALRGNYLFAISLGLVTGARARRAVEAARHHLVVPGALRSLAPLPVSPPLPIHAHDGRLLNDPNQPYQGRYEGDEDTRRKPAYHNGTAWTWTFPTFCEALVRAWDASPEAVAAARAYLGSVGALLDEGCVGQVPEILDGDAPHTQRGCDAQAWGITETLRVWRLLNEPKPRGDG